MPLEWQRCFDLGTPHSYEDALCDELGYRETNEINNALRQHGLTLLVYVEITNGQWIYSNSTKDYRLERLNGEIVYSGIKAYQIVNYIHNDIAKTFNSQAMQEVEPPNLKRSRFTRFSNL